MPTIVPESEDDVQGGAPTVWTDVAITVDTGVTALAIDKTGAAKHQCRITRAAGDFTADGFAVGQDAQVLGVAAGNQRIGEVLAVAAGVLTIADPNELMTDEAAGGDERVYALPEFDVANTGEDVELWVRITGAVPAMVGLRVRSPIVDGFGFGHPWPDPSPLSTEFDRRNEVAATTMRRFQRFSAVRFNEPDGTLRFTVAPVAPAAPDDPLAGVQVGAVQLSSVIDAPTTA